MLLSTGEEAKKRQPMLVRMKETPVRLVFIDLKMNGGYGAKRIVNVCPPGTCSELMKATAQPERICPL
jgi:hypothetical protein